MSDDRRERCQRCDHEAHLHFPLKPECAVYGCPCKGYKPPAPQAEPKAEDGLREEIQRVVGRGTLADALQAVIEIAQREYERAERAERALRTKAVADDGKRPSWFMVEAARELQRRAEADRDRLHELLEHVLRRNHDHSPGCSVCADAQEAVGLHGNN